MSVLNPAGDAHKAMEVMQAGGISILPNDVGYSLIAATPKALHRIFETKRRAPQKLNAMLGNNAHHQALHGVSTRGKEIVQAIARKDREWARATMTAHLLSGKQVIFANKNQAVASIGEAKTPVTQPKKSKS